MGSQHVPWSGGQVRSDHVLETETSASEACLKQQHLGEAAGS